ncbi:hypothetical protein [Frankia sp. CiP3]|uniref:hypothetical protein n=1 Tax=Frankia sp. CiP3 TaxID=2880971 RepID=UPI001EF4EFAA|nr:hypothetical protein [Frankia sp. CiP3]
MTSTYDRAAGSRLLRQLRESRGWSWTDLARALRGTAQQLRVDALAQVAVPSIQRTIARWESPTGMTVPADRYQALLVHLYARTPAGVVNLDAGSDLDRLVTAFQYLGVSSERIDELRSVVARSAPQGEANLFTMLSPAIHTAAARVLRDPALLDVDLLGRLSAETSTIDQQVGTVPFVRLQLRLSPVAEVFRRLLPDAPVPLRKQTAILAAEAFALAGRLAFETHDDEIAAALYTSAVSTASSQDDARVPVAIRTSHTMVTLYTTNDLAAAGRIAAAAVHEANRSQDLAIRARAYAVHAEICARSGYVRRARAALSRAWINVDRTGSNQEDGRFGTDRLAGFEGVCALYGDDASIAHESLARSVATLTRPRDAVQRGIVSTDLALARLRLGDTRACADLLHEAVDLTAHTGGRVPAQRIRHVRGALRPWHREAFVADLDDHIYDALIGR